MTKTLTIFVSDHRSNSSLVVMTALGTTAEKSLVLNFEFGLLEFIWNLVFGAWNFHDFH